MDNMLFKTYEGWRRLALREKTIKLTKLDDFCMGPKYLMIKFWRLRLRLRHWKPLYIHIEWYSDKWLKQLWDDGSIFQGGWMFKWGEAEYKYPPRM